MVQLVPCANCQEPLLLPAGASMQARLECPSCHAQCVLGDMLREHFSSWVVIEEPEPGQLSTPAAAGGSSSAEAATADPEERLSAGSGGPELVLVEADSARPPAPKTNWSEVHLYTHDEYERKKRKARSPIWSILQVALGGLAAIPIALLILWYGLGKDIAGAGPAIGKYAPWIVPARFRPAPDSELAANQQPSEAGSRVARQGGGFRNFDDVLLADGNPVSPDNADSAGAGGAVIEADGKPVGDIPEAMLGPGSGAAGDAGPTASEANVAAEKPDTAETETASDASGTNAAPNTAQVFSLIQSCEKNLDLWAVAYSDKSSDLKEIAQNVYADLVELASALEPLPSDTPVLRVIRDAMQEIGRTVKRRQDVQALVGQGSQFWLAKHAELLAAADQAQTAGFGLATIVEIAEVEERDGLWLIRPTAETAIPSVERVTLRSSIAPALIPEQRLFLLGIVRQQPATSEADIPAPSVWHFEACYLHAL